MSAPAARNRPRVALVTGRLAEFALRSMAARLAAELEIDLEVVVLEISVAALMTPSWVARRLNLPPGYDRVVLPGYCAGDLDPVRAAAGAAVELGPKDLRALPRWFRGETAGEGARPQDYGAHRLEIIAEINHAPRLEHEKLLAAARRYRGQGADVIDLGCVPGETWEGIGEAARRLRGEGFRVAADTFDAREIRLAAAGGAELILSVHGGNVEAARDLGCEVVAIPDDPATLGGLEETVARLEDWKAPHRLDPVIEPIGFGFAASLGRYLEVRRRFPAKAMMMGIGNITELTDADSAGVNALLVGFCSELEIGSVLTTEVIPWARTAVREIDLARRLMHYAASHKVLPKHLEPGLVMLRDPEVYDHGPEVLRELAERIRDPNFRLFAEGGEIHAIRRGLHASGRDPFELFEKLGVEDPSHAFYLGFEMAKALIAIQLGKQYHQDRALRWGFLTVEEESHLERRRRRSPPPAAAEGGEEP